MIPITTSYKLVRYFIRVEQIRSLVEKKRLTLLRNMGGYAQKTAQRSMRRVGKKGKPSKPGTPPKYHGADPSLRTILYGLDPSSGGMIIGPVGFNQKQYYGMELKAGGIPALHEVGGTVGIREKKIGTEWGPIGRKKPRPGQPTRRRNATYPKRPYMIPARDKTVEKFPQLYYGQAAA
jgi:hypothetical protein